MAESSQPDTVPSRHTYSLRELSHQPGRQNLSSTLPSQFLFYALLFLYFVFSSGEQLFVIVSVYKPKIGHIVALILGGSLLFENRVWRVERQLICAFFFILASLVISAVFGEAPLRSFGYVGVYLFNFVAYFLIPLQIIQTVNLTRFFQLYWSAFVAMGLYATIQVALSIFGLYDPFALQRIGTITRGQAWTYEPSYYALYMIPFVMFHNGMALLGDTASQSVWRRRMKLFFQNLLMIISTSTGLIVSYPLFLVTTLFKPINPFQNEVRQKFRRVLFSAILALAGLTLLFYEIALHSLFKFFYFGFLTHFSFWARWQGIVAGLKTFFKHPILGVGLGGVSADQFREESVYDTKIETLEEFEVYDPSNCLTEVLASLGVVGLIAFVYLGFVIFRSYRSVLSHHTIETSSKKIATALFLSLVIMIVALQMNQGLFRPYVWIHTAIVYGYCQRLLIPSVVKRFV